MGYIIHVLPSVGSAGTVTATMISSATVIQNDGSLIATNSSALLSQFTTVNSPVDIQFIVSDTTGQETEYTFTNTVQNVGATRWNGYWMQLGFFTEGSFVPSNLADFLDFDTSGTLGDPDNLVAAPTHDFPPEGAAPVGFTKVANDFFYGATTSGNALQATPVTGSYTLTYTLDIPDFNASMPAGAQIAGGYIFTLRQFALSTPVAAGRRHRNTAWVDTITVSA